MTKVKWMVLFAAACLVVAVAAVAYAAGKAAMPVADTVAARRIILVDGHGKVRAALVVVDGNPALAMQDENGKTRVTLQLRSPKANPTLAFDDRQGKTRALLTLHDNDQPGMALFDAAGATAWATP